MRGLTVTQLTVVTVLMYNISPVCSEGEKSLGYGTKFGTVGNKERRKVIGEAVTDSRQIHIEHSGLGAPPAFIEADSEDVLLAVLHRYQLYRHLVGLEVGSDYREDHCGAGGCPPGSHCSAGLCFCQPGQSAHWDIEACVTDGNVQKTEIKHHPSGWWPMASIQFT